MTAARRNRSFAAAISAYQAAKAAEDAYNASSWLPAYEASIRPDGILIPDDVDTEMERLQEARHGAEKALFATPCVEIRQATLKLSMMQARWGYCGIPEELIGTILADLAALSAAAGEAPSCPPIQTSAASTTVTVDNYRNGVSSAGRR